MFLCGKVSLGELKVKKLRHLRLGKLSSFTIFHSPLRSKSKKKMSFGLFITEKVWSAASRKPDRLNFRVLLFFVSRSMHWKV